MRPGALSWRTSNTLPKGRQSQSNLQCTDNWKRPLNPHSDRRPDHLANFLSTFPILFERPFRSFQKGRAVYPTALLEGISSNVSSSGVSGAVSTQNMEPLVNWCWLQNLGYSIGYKHGMFACRVQPLKDCCAVSPHEHFGNTQCQSFLDIIFQATSKKHSLKFQLRIWKHLHWGYCCFTEEKR